MSRYNRSNFYPKVIVDGKTEFNKTICEFGNSFYNRYFQIKRTMDNYTVKQQDLQRPELISFKIYGTIDYWWLLMKYNNIYDVWNDMYEGQVLSVPNKLDYDDFVIVSSKAL